MALKPEGEEVRAEPMAPAAAPGPAPGQGADDAARAADDAVVSLSPGTLEEALRTIRHLQQKQAACSTCSSSSCGGGGSGGGKTAAQQTLHWRRRALAYEEAVGQLSRVSQEQLQLLSGQLMLLKARLVRKQKDIGRMLAQREAVIRRQQRSIHLLQARLQEAGLEMTHCDLDSPTGETNLDSLNDSDSAVILEDGPGSDQEHSVFPRFRHHGEGGVPVARSVSDAVESPSAKWRQQQFQSQPQRGNGFNFLRRPEVLETVYSVEEDGEADGGGTATASAAAAAAAAATTEGGGPPGDGGSGADPREHHDSARASSLPHSRRTSSQSYKGDSNSSIDVDDTPSADESSCSATTASLGRGGYPQYGSLEVLADAEPPARGPGPGQGQAAPGQHVTTYNRVMSNHRSVTKPKDVKYKRINKAKSKSLEELRGRLRNWVDKGIPSNKFISLDQSYA